MIKEPITLTNHQHKSLDYSWHTQSITYLRLVYLSREYDYMSGEAKRVRRLSWQCCTKSLAGIASLCVMLFTHKMSGFISFKASETLSTKPSM